MNKIVTSYCIADSGEALAVAKSLYIEMVHKAKLILQCTAKRDDPKLKPC